MTAPAFEEVPGLPVVAHLRPDGTAWGGHGPCRAGDVDAFPVVRLSDALAYGDQRANAALQQAYDAMFSLKGDKVTRFDAQTAIRALKTGPTPARECLWAPDADGYWKTACGHGHTFITDGPPENNHRFCCYCGGRISMKENGDAGN